MKPDASIADLLREEKRPLFSVEFFPPKDEAGVAHLRKIAETLKEVRPDFVSVTYGAGGSTRARTNEVSEILRKEFGYTVMPHLTCVGSSRTELLKIVREHHQKGVRNIMALRGDPPVGQKSFTAHKDGLRYAGDLVQMIREKFPGICIGAAGYPEKHVEAPDMETDLAHLKKKVQQGTNFITTQLFFENRFYFDFVQRCREIGIDVPIFPGVMPVVSLKQIQRFTNMCGASLPKNLIAKLKSAENDAETMEDEGIEWALEQIKELLARGAPGIHLYILNRSRAALSLFHSLADGFLKSA